MGQYEPKALTPRHMAILRLVAEGRRVSEVASTLGCSRQTVSRIAGSKQGREHLDRLIMEHEAASRRAAALVPLVHAGLVRFP